MTGKNIEEYRSELKKVQSKNEDPTLYFKKCI